MTTKRMIGYSVRIVERNREADARSSIGVRLGRQCIKNDIPASEVATHFGVTRQTVYNWFSGDTEPSAAVYDDIKAMLKDKKQFSKLAA